MMKKYFGFTILELMVTIAIAGILMAVALPSYQTMVKNNCLTTSANSLVSSLQRARSEAIKRRSDVTMAATGGDWGAGWNVTLDEDRNNNSTLDDGEDYNGNGSLDNSVTILTSNLSCGAAITGSATSVTYGSDGFLTSGSTETFDVCDDRTAETGRELSISITGRPNMNSEFTCP